MVQSIGLLRRGEQTLRTLLLLGVSLALLTGPSLPAGAAAATFGLDLPPGFSGEKIARVRGARELAMLPNGDLLVGTSGDVVKIIPHAEAPGAAGTPSTFIMLDEEPAAGVALGPDGNIYVATNRHVWRIGYRTGALTGGDPVAVATVRSGPVAPHSDNDVHDTTSVAVSATTIYISVGASCNACREVDPTRASIQQVPLHGGSMTPRAVHIRNAIALALNPATGSVWAAGAGQDTLLPKGHPYEYADNVSAHQGVADYGWPACEENRIRYNPLKLSPPPSCAQSVVPLVEFPAYSTHIGAVFYPGTQRGAYAFPAHYRGGLFVASHGSWHCCPSTMPKVAFVPMRGDVPLKPVDWHDPTTQWEPFLFDPRARKSDTEWGVRFTGVAVGPQGSLFVGDDQSAAVYRVRPAVR